MGAQQSVMFKGNLGIPVERSKAMQELGLSPFIWDNFFTNWLSRSRNTDTTNQLEFFDFFDSWFVMVPRRGGTRPELPRVMIVVLWLSQHRTLTSRYLMVYTFFFDISGIWYSPLIFYVREIVFVSENLCNCDGHLASVHPFWPKIPVEAADMK